MFSRSLRRLGFLTAAVCVLSIGVAPRLAAADPSTGVITGTFVSATRGPIANASAQALDANNLNTVASTQTAEDGSFTLSLPPGTYLVYFTSFEVGSQFVPQTENPFGATRFTLAAGQTVTVNETALPTGRITGRLVNASGAPVANSDVTIINEQTTRLSGRTDEDGRYQTAPIRAGRYRIGFSLPGNLGAVQYVPQKLILEEASFFEVVADQTITVDEQLLATGFIVGRVESTDGRPLAGASVNVLDARHAGAGFTRTGDNGEFRTEVFPGQYRISFSTPDFSRFQYFVGAKTFEDATVFTVEAGRDTTVTDRLLPTGDVRVTARDARTGAPIADFCAGAESASGCSGGAGEVRLTGVVAGPTTVFAYTEDGRYFGGDTTVTVEGNGSVDAVVTLRPAALIQTVVRDAVTGQPVEGVCVHPVLLPSVQIGESFQFCSDASGTVRIGTLESGSYKLFARPPADSGYGMQWVGPHGGTGELVEARTTRAVAGTVTQIPDIRLDRAGTIAGRLTAAAGGASPTFAIVSLTSYHPGIGPSLFAPVDEQGRYEFPGLGPYSWPLLFSASGKPDQWSGNKPNRLAAQKVRVRAGATTRYDITLLDGATVTGRANDNGDFVLATNVVTGDIMGAASIENGRYTMEVLGVQVVQMTGGGPKTPIVVVPRSGTRTADMT